MEKFLLIKDAVKNVRRFNLQGRTLEFKIKPIPAGEEPVGWIKEAINQIIAKATEDLDPSDQVSFSFCSKDFSKGQAWVRFRPAQMVTYDHVWKTISSVYQSNSAGLNTESFCLGVTSVRMPTGRGKDRARLYNTFEEECSKRRGIISINNKDNLCLPRALVVAIAHVTKDRDLKKVRQDIGKIQSLRALELCRNANVSIAEAGAGIPELQQFQRHLDNHNIVVYQYGSKGRDVIFKGMAEGLNLNLLYHEGHYNVITSLTAAFCCVYYCETCNIPYNTKGKHRCCSTCPACQQTPACPKDIAITCADCQRSFRGQQCYDNHTKQGAMGKNSLCEQIYRCTDCYKVVKRGRNHICGEIFCKICNAHAPSDHLCYMQPDHSKPKINDIIFVFYDLETRQETETADGSLLHEPNLCVFKQCCSDCLTSQSPMCSRCGVRMHVLKTAPVSRFMELILNQRKLFKQVVVIAHNGQAFDHQFCLNYILTKTDLKPELIMRGTKIISIVVGNVKFLDSLNYFPMPLSKLPNAFGLASGFKKGYFPHLFNTSANANYTGPLPAVEYYDPDNMKSEDRVKFLTWYEEHKSCVTQQQKDQYIHDFLNNEGVKLEFAEVAHNPGLRALAKLMLNSFWGKFGQRENHPKTSVVRDPAQFFSMLTNPGIYVNSALPINEDTLVVNWEHRDEAFEPLSTVNVVIAAYVTTQARLKLYSYLERLGDRVLYYDTDSVIYVSRPGEYDVPTGEFLGDMTDELEGYGPGSYITEFVSGGPKNYAYKLYSTKENQERVVCKVKGISLNYNASQLVHFNSIKNMVLDTTASPLCVVSRNILRTKEYEVVTVQQKKLYRPLSTKRCFLENHSSVPYGFKRLKYN